MPGYLTVGLGDRGRRGKGRHNAPRGVGCVKGLVRRGLWWSVDLNGEKSKRHWSGAARGAEVCAQVR